MPAMDFRTESLRGLSDAVRSKRVGARELVAHALDRIEHVNPQVNAFVAVDGERALAEASRIDDRVAAGESVGPLAGIPIGVKDLEPAAGFVTSFGSRLFAGDPPAEADSVQVARLRAAGAVVVGKTNTPEEGWKGDTDNLVFGRTANPWSLTHSAGGSSGGSAAAIAAGMVPMATGSDGGGSIRIPSALCGLTGMKASFGRVAVGGDAPGWVDLSARGPMARRLADIAYALEVVAGPHPTDPRSLPAEPGLFALDGLPALPARVGWSPTLGYAPVDAEVADRTLGAVKRLAEEGVEVLEIDSVFPEDPIRTFLTLANIGTLRALAAQRERWDLLDPGLRAGLEWAERSVTVLDYAEAIAETHRLSLRLHEVLSTLGVDLLVTPATAAVTPIAGQPGVINGSPDPNWVRFTYPFNLTRSPAGVVNAGYTDSGLPIGLQVVGPMHGDRVVLEALAAFEGVLGDDRLAPIR